MEIEDKTEELGEKQNKKQTQQHKTQASQLHMLPWNILLFQLRRILSSP